MPIQGWSASFLHARARYRTLILSAFCMACAVSLRAPAAAAAPAPAAVDPVADLRPLAVARDPSAGGRILAALRQGPPALRRAALVSLLSNLPPGTVSVKDMSPWLSDPDAAVRGRAATAVGRLGGKAAVRALLPLAADPNPGVRLTAVFWLGALRDPAATAALGRTLSGDSNADVRTQAARALKRVGTRRARRELRGASRDEDARVRRAARE